MPGFKANARGQVNALVTLACTPERFHVLAFQQFGRVSGTQDETIELRGVQVANLDAVAGPIGSSAWNRCAPNEVNQPRRLQ